MEQVLLAGDIEAHRIDLNAKQQARRQAAVMLPDGSITVKRAVR